ncbi:MAG: hypothetical protein ABEJ31_12765, partial [Haloarculaceae archaeon]
RSAGDRREPAERRARCCDLQGRPQGDSDPARRARRASQLATSTNPVTNISTAMPARTSKSSSFSLIDSGFEVKRLISFVSKSAR